MNSILESSYAWPRRQREADLHFNLEEEEEVEPPRLLKEEWRYIKAIAAAFRENLWVNTLWKCQIQTRGCRWKLLCPNQWCMQQKMADGRVSSDTDRLHKRVIETYVPVFEWKIIRLEVQTLNGRHVFEFDIFGCYSFDDFPKNVTWL